MLPALTPKSYRVSGTRPSMSTISRRASPFSTGALWTVTFVPIGSGGLEPILILEEGQLDTMNRAEQWVTPPGVSVGLVTLLLQLRADPDHGVQQALSPTRSNQ